MKPFVTINLDRPRKLRYGYNQLCELEDLLGVPMSNLGEMSLGLKEIRLFLYVGLIKDDPELTIEAVGDLIDEAESITEVADKITEALTAAFGEPKNVTGPAASGAGKKP